MNSKAEEYQEEFGKILNEEGYESPEDTICSYHSLVEDMIETIKYLEETTSKEYQAKRLKLEASIRTGIKTHD